jgi:hypothetical protein
MSRIELAKMYSRTRYDGAPTLSGRIGSARLRIEPNPQHDPQDPKSADFLAFIEEVPPQSAPATPYRGPQLGAPRPMESVSAPRRPAAALPDFAIEGEVVDPLAD